MSGPTRARTAPQQTPKPWRGGALWADLRIWPGAVSVFLKRANVLVPGAVGQQPCRGCQRYMLCRHWLHPICDGQQRIAEHPCPARLIAARSEDTHDA